MGRSPHVPPPQIDGQGLGMRVPMLVISAYAREASPGIPGYLSHTRYSFGSILKFVEDNWKLGRLGTSDSGSKSIGDCFDFEQAPRAFTPIGPKYSQEYFLKRPPSGLATIPSSCIRVRSRNGAASPGCPRPDESRKCRARAHRLSRRSSGSSSRARPNLAT
jgi:hypothetical protein